MCWYHPIKSLIVDGVGFLRFPGARAEGHARFNGHEVVVIQVSRCTVTMARLVTSGIGTLTPLVVALLRANLDLLVEPKVPELSTGFVGSWTFMRINGAIRLGNCTREDSQDKARFGVEAYNLDSDAEVVLDWKRSPNCSFSMILWDWW